MPISHLVLSNFSYLDAMMSDNGLAKMMQVKNFNVGMINEYLEFPYQQEEFLAIQSSL